MDQFDGLIWFQYAVNWTWNRRHVEVSGSTNHCDIEIWDDLGESMEGDKW